MIRILFCNISYLLYYNTRLDRVAPKNGGAYVAKMHDAYEKHNFEECADGDIFKHGKTESWNQHAL
mgnify:CR=1 FL=1